MVPSEHDQHFEARRQKHFKYGCLNSIHIGIIQDWYFHDVWYKKLHTLIRHPYEAFTFRILFVKKQSKPIVADFHSDGCLIIRGWTGIALGIWNCGCQTHKAQKKSLKSVSTICAHIHGCQTSILTHALFYSGYNQNFSFFHKDNIFWAIMLGLVAPEWFMFAILMAIVGLFFVVLIECSGIVRERSLRSKVEAVWFARGKRPYSKTKMSSWNFVLFTNFKFQKKDLWNFDKTFL